MRRRFELGGLLGSFFEVRVDGPALFIKIGSGGRNVREQSRPQASPEAARAELERLVAAHLAKGYVEVAPLAESGTTKIHKAIETRSMQRERLEREQAEHEAREKVEALQAELGRRRGKVEICTNPELEAQCEATPDDDPAPWAVYADWLAERGDPRGVVANLHLRGDAATAREVFDLHRETLCRTIAPAKFTFQHGFARGVTLPPYLERAELADVVGAILDAPIARFIDEVRTGLAGFGGRNNWQATAAAIARSPRAPHVRVVRFDNYEYDDSMMHFVEVGDLRALTELPRLEALHVRGEPVTWGTIALPTLRRFVRETCRLTTGELAEVCAMPWPVLQELELWFGSSEYGVDVTVDDLAPLLEGTAFPRLGHLGIVNCDLVRELIPQLATSSLLPRLYSLDLSMGTLGSEFVPLLVRHAPAFRHLASIELENNFFTPEDAERITAVLDNVVIGPQRDLDEDGDDPAHRFVAEHE